MPSETFVEMMSEKILGDPQVKSQHMLGESTFVKHSTSSISARYQVLAVNQRYKDDGSNEVTARSHGHGEMQFFYTCLNGKWKLSGLKAGTTWFEHQFGKVFAFLQD